MIQCFAASRPGERGREASAHRRYTRLPVRDPAVLGYNCRFFPAARTTRRKRSSATVPQEEAGLRRSASAGATLSSGRLRPGS
jgi:hypothetical protein